jgi:excisionase family DNA binding protein
VSGEREADVASTPTLLTTREAADRLRVHPRTVQRLVERGELSAVHLGSAVRFDPADLAGLTERLKHRAPTVAVSRTDSIRPTRTARLTFAERLRSRNDEHRTAET